MAVADELFSPQIPSTGPGKFRIRAHMSSLIKSIRNDSAIAACGDAAREHFSSLYCAESVLRAVAEAEGVTSELIPRIATGFCAGLSRMGGLCGAVAGGIMAISMVHGRDVGEEPVQEAYVRVAALQNAVQDAWGSTNCHALTGCDLNTEEGQDRFRNGGVKEGVCLAIASDCASLALWLVRNDLATLGKSVDLRAGLRR